MKYKVVKPVPDRQWEVGDIVEVVSSKTFTSDVLEVYEGDEPNKHVLAVVDPIKLFNTIKSLN